MTTNDDGGQPNSPGEHLTERTRGPDGRYIRELATAERDAEAARLRSRGMSYRAIATDLGVEVAAAHAAVQRALAAVVAEPAADVRALELDRLDAMYAAVLGVLERKHITVNNGKVIQLPDEDGKLTPLEDDAPILQAVDRLLKIQARRAALLGLDAPVKAETGVTLNYVIQGVDLGQL